MTLTDELKILDDKIIANQARHYLDREAAKISALSSKDLLEKYEYLTDEDLQHRPSVLEITKFEYSLLGISLSKSFKKDNVKSIAKSKTDFNYVNYKFYRFYKQYDEFEEMSLDSKYKRINEFNKRLNKFKALKPIKPETQLRKGRIMKNVDELYENITILTKNDFDDDDDDDDDEDDELSGAKKKKFAYNLNCLIKQTKS